MPVMNPKVAPAAIPPALQPAEPPARAKLSARDRRSAARKRRTGPHTAAGKRRVALNSRRKDLCPAPLERELKARGEDVREFRRLHRDLIGWLQPDDDRSRVVVEGLAEVWWRKRRRLRSAVGAVAPDTGKIDAEIDELLQLFVGAVRDRHRKWRSRLERVLGPGLRGPYFVRTSIEARLAALGGKPEPRRRATRSRKPAPPVEEPRSWIERMLAKARERLKVAWAAREAARASSARGVAPPG
ncbi:MAG TPA: hypothetical protein VL523_06535 [Terriglobia bacterium]|nr:hypothetical protein [Terriglobia bacterium]